MLRLQRACMLALAVMGCLGAALHTARAAFDAQVLTATRGLLGIPEAWVRSEPRSIVLNGAHVRVATGHSEVALHALLDRAETECRGRSGGLHARASRAAEHVKRSLPSLSDGILRVEGEREGLVACLDLGSSTASFEDLAQRLSEFAEHGDLQALGGVRLLRAEARSEGAFFVSTWNEGSAPLWDMFPASGDAPGIDFEDVPRPTGSRRLLSTWQENGEPAINVYESDEALDELWERYTHTLTSRGYLEGNPEHAQSAPQHALLLVKGGRQLVVTAEVQNGKTLLALMPLQAGPGAMVASVHAR